MSGPFRARWIVLLCTMILLVACGKRDVQTDGALSGRLTITGSSTIAPLVNEIARRFEQEHAGVRIDVQTGGTSRGITYVRRNTAEIGMVSRAMLADETDLDPYLLAMDGVSIIVHKDNPVTELTPDQVVAIYLGRVTRWSEVGGADNPITVVNKAEGRSTLDLFLDFFHIRNEDIRPHVIIGDNQHGIRTVVGDPNAIGYVSIGTAEHEVSQGTPIKLLPVDGIQPTVANVRNGTFPLKRPLHLVTKSPVSD